MRAPNNELSLVHEKPLTSLLNYHNSDYVVQKNQTVHDSQTSFYWTLSAVLSPLALPPVCFSFYSFASAFSQTHSTPLLIRPFPSFKPLTFLTQILAEGVGPAKLNEV